MRDSEVVASIVAGDPDGLAEAYDRYADALFGYCRSLLREPADAADAVQDTFVIAASRLSGLRDRELLRPWLYAVARNECLRRLKSREAASALGEDTEQADETVDVGEEAERAETRALLRAAVDGLNPAERDVIIQVLSGLDVAEIAKVLGVSRNHAHSLFSRARHQLETSVGVLIIARTGRQDCQELDTLLTAWDGRLTAQLRKQIARHVDKCEICSDRRRRALTPAMLLGLSPGALVGALAAHAAAHPAPAALRDMALRIATGNDLDAQAYRSALGRTHASFGPSGFPKPLRAGHHMLPRVPHPRLAAAAAALAAAVAAIVVLATSAGQHHALSASGGPLPGGRTSGAQPGGAPSGTAPSGTAPGGTPSAAPSGARSGGGSSVPPSHGTLGSPGSSPSPSPTVPPTGSGSASPTPARSSPTTQPTVTPTRAPTPTPTRTPTPTPTRAPTPTPTRTRTPPPPPAGTLAVSPTTILLTPLLGQTITLTAENGPVTWSISEPSSLLGELTVAPSSGVLAAGQSVQVTVTVSGLASLDTNLTVSPGGQQITVLVGLL